MEGVLAQTSAAAGARELSSSSNTPRYMNSFRRLYTLLACCVAEICLTALTCFGCRRSKPSICCLCVLQAHIWGLDRQLDKFTTDYVQQHLQRGSHGLLTLSEMDFAFPPNVSPAMIVQARLKGHASVSSAGLAPVQFGSKNAASKKSKLPGGIGWLREVRVLQDPNPRLHNFPEVC